jgi:hypothetical protein
MPDADVLHVQAWHAIWPDNGFVLYMICVAKGAAQNAARRAAIWRQKWLDSEWFAY